jgi:hypothetical protein
MAGSKAGATMEVTNSNIARNVVGKSNRRVVYNECGSKSLFE